MARATDAIAVITVVVGVLILGAGFALGWIVVVADQRGLRVRGSIGVPLKSIPADSIREVSVVELSALRWGGWGYRVSPQGAAVVTRTGPALRVQTDSARFFVTVAGADDAVQVLIRNRAKNP